MTIYDIKDALASAYWQGIADAQAAVAACKPLSLEDATDLCGQARAYARTRVERYVTDATMRLLGDNVRIVVKA